MELSVIRKKSPRMAFGEILQKAIPILTTIPGKARVNVTLGNFEKTSQREGKTAVPICDLDGDLLKTQLSDHC